MLRSPCGVYCRQAGLSWAGQRSCGTGYLGGALHQGDLGMPPRQLSHLWRETIFTQCTLPVGTVFPGGLRADSSWLRPAAETQQQLMPPSHMGHCF
jgi:hypothetical protein